MDIPEVRKAREKALDDDLADFIFNSDIRIDQRAAVINALGWGVNHSDVLKNYLIKQYGFNKKLKLQELNDEELLLLAYRTALDDYFHPKKALIYLNELKKRPRRKSRTFAIISSLIYAQIAFDKNWCGVFKVYYRARTVKNLAEDFRSEALNITDDYMYLYKSYCKKKKNG